MTCFPMDCKQYGNDWRIKLKHINLVWPVWLDTIIIQSNKLLDFWSIWLLICIILTCCFLFYIGWIAFNITNSFDDEYYFLFYIPNINQMLADFNYFHVVAYLCDILCNYVHIQRKNKKIWRTLYSLQDSTVKGQNRLKTTSVFVICTYCKALYHGLPF